MNGVNNILLHQIRISGLPDTWTAPDELFGAILCLFRLFCFLYVYVF